MLQLAGFQKFETVIVKTHNYIKGDFKMNTALPLIFFYKEENLGKIEYMDELLKIYLDKTGEPLEFKYIPIDKEKKQTLIAWYEAHKQTSTNSSLLLLNHTKFSDLCASRMNVSQIADNMLYAISLEDEDNPKELTRHLKANQDKSCCSHISILKDKHPECIEKSNEWFESQKNLLQHIQKYLLK